MRHLSYFLIVLTLGLTSVNPFISFDNNFSQSENLAYGQSSINVTESVPCFLNYTGSNYITSGNASTTGIEFLQNCGFGVDYLSAVTVSFDWVTGGLFPMILVVVLIVFTYVKYQTGIYPIAIGIVWLPFSYQFFPDEFISFGLAIGAIIGAGAVVTALIKRTKEY